jgi:quinol monooxygenase YgiN
MIIRVFRAKIKPGKIEDFKQLVQTQSIPWLMASEGMLGYFAGEPLDRDGTEFVMVTLWRDLDSLQRFVGGNWQTPMVTPDEAPLVDEMLAYHYSRFDRT